VPYPLLYDHGWQIDFPSLEKAITPRTRGIVLVHPNNPTGSFVRTAEADQVNALCRDRGLALIVDEVFLDYALSEDPVGTVALGRPVEPSSTASPPPYASFAGNQEVLTFTLSGLSKISALPQMKVSWVVTSGPEAEVEAAMGRLEVIADTYLSMNAPIQWAMPVLMDERKNIQQQLLERVKRNLAELDCQLAEQKSCQRLSVAGGWYAVLRVPVTRSDEELAIELVREKSVMVHPGHFYDFPSDGYLVLSLITNQQEFREGIGRVLDKVNC
jgi:alanine-synthesizing transaminase